MTTKRTRTYNPAWPDSPEARTARSLKRRQELRAAAIANGFASWSELATAVKNGEAVVVKVKDVK